MRHVFILSPQARAFNLPLDQNVLEYQWNQLVASHFGELEQDIKSLITENTPTGGEFVRTDLLNELGWADTRKDFDYLVKGKAGFRRVRTCSVGS